MVPYRFSPITTQEQLDRAWEYIASELSSLALTVTGMNLPVNTLKVFPHYPEEYEFLHTAILPLGPQAPFSSATSLYVETEREISGQHIKYLGVRIVDPYRLHVGCGDYEIEDFAAFKQSHLGTSPYLREFSDQMLELWHPDFDVLGYIVPVL